MRRKLVVLHHAAERARPRARYLVRLLDPHLEAAGWQVEHLFGIRRHPAADAILLHVDLSVVPGPYLDFARGYPLALNAGARDIRKTVTSRQRVLAGDGYAGPVIVKSALNYAGIPERRIERRRRWFAKRPRTGAIRSKRDYRLHASAAELAPEVFADEERIVERFLPERHGDRYCLREWYFFGPASIDHVELSHDPIFTTAEPAPELALPAPPELVALRREYGLDYGKIDWVMHEGRPVVFDLNKTPGYAAPGPNPPPEDRLKSRLYAAQLAGGMLALLETNSGAP